MSRGIGRLQRAILAALAPDAPSSTSELAGAVGADPRQVRAAVVALEDRGLVVCRRNCCIGYRKDQPRVRRRWTTPKLSSESVRVLHPDGPLYDRADMPIPGTLVWSLPAWEAECDLQERASAAGGHELPRNHRDRADPRRAPTKPAEQH